jgi:hypothetical protein
MINRPFRAFGSGILLLLTNAAFSAGIIVADPSSNLGPVSASQGAANLAASLRHDSLILNPAAATGEDLYSLAALYGASGDLMEASIVDTKSGPIGGGAYYMRKSTSSLNPDGFLGNYDRSEEQAGLSLMGRVSDTVGLGIMGRYIRTTIKGDKKRSDWDGDVGFRWQAASTLMVAAVARSLLKEKSGLSPAQYSAGVTWVPYPGIAVSGSTTKTILDSTGSALAVELPNPTKRMSYAAGVEWRLQMGIGIRAGYNWLNPWGQAIASAGIGYLNKGFSVDYSYSGSTRGADYSQHLIGLSFEL